MKIGRKTLKFFRRLGLIFFYCALESKSSYNIFLVDDVVGHLIDVFGQILENENRILIFEPIYFFGSIFGCKMVNI